MNLHCCPTSILTTWWMTHKGLVSAWWKKNEHNFLFPPAYIGHTHQWEKLDIDTVGCKLCGIVHCCSFKTNIVDCHREIQDDSSVVCTITGIVLNTHSFFDEQISIENFRHDSLNVENNTAHVEKRMKLRHGHSDFMEVTRNMAKNIINRLMYSTEAENSQMHERMRVKRKVQAAFTKYITSKKDSCDSFSIVDALAVCFTAYNAHSRDHDREKPPISKWNRIIEHICFVLYNINLPKSFRACEKNINFFNLIVTYFYLAKNGLVVDDIVYIPKYESLRDFLPLEVLLWTSFKIQSKIITDGENQLKNCIRMLSEEQKTVFKRHVFEY